MLTHVKQYVKQSLNVNLCITVGQRSTKCERAQSQNVNSRDIVCHTITKENQHLEFRSRTFCVDSHQVKECFQATAGTKTVEK
jgi:hypothetical protein